MRLAPGWLLTIAVATVLLLPALFQDGMFIDGIFYAILSRNLAEGLGSFWALHFSQTYEPVFFAHPPLAMWLESWFFRLCGTAYWVERLYGLCAFGLSAALLSMVWRTLFPQRASYDWLIVLGWLIVPRVFWSFTHNMLENTLTVWNLAACWAMLKALLDPRWRYGGGILAGLLTLAALYTKGPVGLFPLAIPLLWSVAHRDFWGDSLRLTLVSSFTLAVVFGLIWLYEPAATFWQHYFSKQLVRSFNGQLATETSRIFLLRRLVEELLVPAGLTLLLLFLSWPWRKLRIAGGRERLLFALLVGLSASLPLLLSPKLRDFYLVPAVPFFAIALLGLTVEALHQRLQDLQHRVNGRKTALWLSSMALLLALGFAASQWGHPRRDEAVLAQVQAIGQIVPPGAIVHICPDMEHDYALRWYLSRYYGQSQDQRMRGEHHYFLLRKPCPDFAAEHFTLRWQNAGLSLYERD